MEHPEPELMAALFPSGEISKLAGSSCSGTVQLTCIGSKLRRTNCRGFLHRTYSASPSGESRISIAVEATCSLRAKVRLAVRISCTEPFSVVSAYTRALGAFANTAVGDPSTRMWRATANTSRSTTAIAPPS